MTGPVQQTGVNGMTKLAHAIRRSTALYVAMSITPEDGSIEDLLANATRLAAWVRGEAEDEPQQTPQFPSR